jgi:threonine/homoserine/homoserine lactone efflux protein
VPRPPAEEIRMDHSRLIIFASAYLAVLILPGPGVSALVARVLARGPQGSPAFIAGFVMGSLTWFAIAATGLAMLAASFAAIFSAIRYGGAAYLLYLACKLWKSQGVPLTDVEPTLDNGRRLFLTGLAINLGNPKVIVFFLALLPTVVDLGNLTPLGFFELAITIAIIAGGVLTAYAMAAAHARRLFTSPKAVRLVNRGSSAVMAATAVTIATR